MRSSSGRIDALLGLTDALALAARDIGRSFGLVDRQTLVWGFGGEPAALAAIARGELSATVQ